FRCLLSHGGSHRLIPANSSVSQIMPQPAAAAPACPFMDLQSACLEFNGTHRFLEQYTYNRELFVQLDSAMGLFAAVSHLGRLTAKSWNIQREFLHNFDLDERFTLKRRGDRAGLNETLWTGWTWAAEAGAAAPSGSPGARPAREGEETAGVLSTNSMHNGDWTFQILVMLEMTPQQGDVYVCRVEHPSLDSPVTVEWKAQSDSAQSKMLAGLGGFALGLTALRASFILRFRSQRGKKLLESG
uniref:Uncharacterized protein n=1 Tax=Ailuropoda melanoleuca TaxID=9646 RepID=G1L536_AILME